MLKQYKGKKFNGTIFKNYTRQYSIAMRYDIEIQHTNNSVFQCRIHVYTDL